MWFKKLVSRAALDEVTTLSGPPSRRGRDRGNSGGGRGGDTGPQMMASP